MSLHNDLATWAGRARRAGRDTITLDIKTAEAVAARIVEMGNEIIDLRNRLRDYGIELSHGLNEMKQALTADRTKLLALGADPGPTEDELFGNGIINLNSALDLAEDMTVAPGYGDMQDALGVLAKAYRKAEDRIGELLVKNDAKAAALSRAEALLAEAREGLRIIAGEQQCADNLMGDKDIARALLAKLEQG